jgi:hypothetical protein
VPAWTMHMAVNGWSMGNMCGVMQLFLWVCAELNNFSASCVKNGSAFIADNNFVSTAQTKSGVSQLPSACRKWSPNGDNCGSQLCMCHGGVATGQSTACTLSIESHAHVLHMLVCRQNWSETVKLTSCQNTAQLQSLSTYMCTQAQSLLPVRLSAHACACTTHTHNGR